MIELRKFIAVKWILYFADDLFEYMCTGYGGPQTIMTKKGSRLLIVHCEFCVLHWLQN
jgi:hypothetical protein